MTMTSTTTTTSSSSSSSSIKISSFNPPVPDEGSTSKNDNDNENNTKSKSYNDGQRLLNLIRKLERKQNNNSNNNNSNDDELEVPSITTNSSSSGVNNDNGYEELMDEIVDLFNTLILSIPRRGLLQSNTVQAERILSSSSPSASSNINNNNNNSSSGGSSNKKGSSKRGGGGGSSNNNSNELLMHPNNGNHDGTASAAGNNSTAQQQETLIFTAILRILGGNNTNNTNSSEQQQQDNNTASSLTTFNKDKFLLIALAAQLSLAISQSIKMRNDHDKCVMAEYEILSQSGKELLKSMVTTLQAIETFLRQQAVAMTTTKTKKRSSPEKYKQQCLLLITLDDDNDDNDFYVTSSIDSCLKAAASLVDLFGTKLSRSTTLLSDLNAMAWTLLMLPNDTIQLSASKLIATLPNAITTSGNSNSGNSASGGMDRKTPPSSSTSTSTSTPSVSFILLSWNEAMVDIIWMLGTIVEKIAPVNKISHKNEKGLSNQAKSLVQHWTIFLRDYVMEESDRVTVFYRLVYGLSKCFLSLLKRDGTSSSSSTSNTQSLGKKTTTDNNNNNKLDIESILSIIESFLSYPLSAETIFFKTKKRLRNESSIDDYGSLLSSRVISSQIANHIKRIGHSMLDCVLSSIGGPPLMPLARRIIRISYASLLTSCSGPVRKVIDPTNGIQLDAKRKRWLHLSIPVRTTTIRTFMAVITVFGSDRTGRSNSNNNNDRSTQTITKSDGELAASLVAGCMIEEFSKNYNNNHSALNETDDDDDWGDFSERLDLICQCCHALKAVLVSCGGFLSDSTRSIIDSSIYTGLIHLSSLTNHSLYNVFDWSPIKVAILDVACTCLATPWNDGASSNITGTLLQVSRMLESDHHNHNDSNVLMAAKTALQFCDLAYVPRAPALVLITRTAMTTTTSNDDNTAVAAASAVAASGSTNSTISTVANQVMKDLKMARDESIKATKAVQEAEKAKRQKIEEKRLREQQQQQLQQQAKEEREKKRQKVKQEDSSKTETTTTTTKSKDDDTKADNKPAESAGDPTNTTTTATSGDDSNEKQGTSKQSSRENKSEEEVEGMEIDKGDQNNDDGAENTKALKKAAAADKDENSDSDGNNDNDDGDGDDDDEFPDIVQGGGPDSDDE